MREIPACVQMLLNVNVAPLILGWLGMVSGVRVPSALSRTIAMCSRSRTIRNPSFANALMTLARGASTGNLAIGFEALNRCFGDEHLECG